MGFSKSSAKGKVHSNKLTLRKKRKRRILHNDQRINPRRRYNNYYYICSQHRNTAIYKATAKSMRGEINSNTIIVGDFKTLIHHSHLWIDQLNRKLARKHKL